MINIKEQRGSVTLFVVISCLFFIATVVCIQMNMNSKQISADREYRQIKSNYEKDINNADEIYSNLLLENNLEVQFADIECNNINENNINISAKIIFNIANIDVRELKYGWINSQNIIQNFNSDSIENWTYVENANGFNQIIATLDNVPNQGYYYLVLRLNNKEFWTPINYAKNGIVLHLDAINNLGTGDRNHSLETTLWKDLSGNGNDSTVNNAIFGKNYVNLDGQQSWVNCGEINNEFTTLETVIELKNFTMQNGDKYRIFGNWHSGGCGLYIQPERYIIGDVYTNSWNSAITSNEVILPNRKYFVTLTYDGNTEAIYINGIKKTYQTYEGTILPPRNNTVMALGCNPSGSQADGEFFNGKIYSARIYNRALSEEEIVNNYKVDKARFDIEE